MDVEEYVLGVLPGVIPADYEVEALKVQAVLIRTNVLKEMEEKGTKDAKDLSYRYLTKEERQELWGMRQYDRNEKRIERAVCDTAGDVIKQEDKLIMALYHEVSIGKTANASEVLDEDISYLQSVESNHDVEAANYLNTIEYKWEDMSEILEKCEVTDTDTTEQDTDGTNESEQDTGGGKSENHSAERIETAIEESSENGFVKKISIAGKMYSGTEAMELLHLPSVNFYVEEKEDGVRFVCLGKGDCLGVSQYGANYMAADGSSMEDIINYYYKNVSIKKAFDD